MEYLILQGVPQRTAHHTVGTIVRKAMENNTPLRDLPLHEMQAICNSVDERVYEVLGTENALRTFRSLGSTAPDEVKSQIARWQERLKSE